MPPIILSDKNRFEKEGRVWWRRALNEVDLIKIENICVLNNAPGSRLHSRSELSGLMKSLASLQIRIDTLLPKSKIVRAVVFDKSTKTNWGVPWHQDCVIAVKEKYNIEGYDLWTKKSGVWHVEPPVNVLEEMMFIRVHLDESTVKNGALELALGSHKYGRIKGREMKKIIHNSTTELCTAQRGDILIVKALTLHRSLKSNTIQSRRALRVDYSHLTLPDPLEWEFSELINI